MFKKVFFAILIINCFLIILYILSEMSIFGDDYTTLDRLVFGLLFIQGIVGLILLITGVFRLIFFKSNIFIGFLPKDFIKLGVIVIVIVYIIMSVYSWRIAMW